MASGDLGVVRPDILSFATMYLPSDLGSFWSLCCTKWGTGLGWVVGWYALPSHQIILFPYFGQDPGDSGMSETIPLTLNLGGLRR